ncbi:MAG: hypothetical protein RMJ39_10845 [Deltaproteobacteria bacterium]|nr:hypothetical protein [Deltaproteobacteria bacterium]
MRGKITSSKRTIKTLNGLERTGTQKHKKTKGVIKRAARYDVTNATRTK